MVGEDRSEIWKAYAGWVKGLRIRGLEPSIHKAWSTATDRMQDKMDAAIHNIRSDVAIELQRLSGENALLREVIDNYASHDEDCNRGINYTKPGACSCGFKDAKEEL